MINTRTLIAGLAPDIALPLPLSPHYNRPKGNSIDTGSTALALAELPS
jgi:hypothetical protein